MASFMQIPEECLLMILARVDLQSLCHVSATCQYMRTLIKVGNMSSCMHTYSNMWQLQCREEVSQPCIGYLTI